MTIYRVRKIGTEEYSKGGLDCRFNKKGKVWNGSGPLKCHLALIKRYAEAWKRGGHSTNLFADYLASVEVVPFIVGEVERSPIPVADSLT